MWHRILFKAVCCLRRSRITGHDRPDLLLRKLGSAQALNRCLPGRPPPRGCRCTSAAITSSRRGPSWLPRLMTSPTPGSLPALVRRPLALPACSAGALARCTAVRPAHVLRVLAMPGYFVALALLPQLLLALRPTPPLAGLLATRQTLTPPLPCTVRQPSCSRWWRPDRRPDRRALDQAPGGTRLGGAGEGRGGWAGWGLWGGLVAWQLHVLKPPRHALQLSSLPQPTVC